MKLYSNKKSYVYNRSLYDKKKLQTKIVSLALAFNVFVGSTSVLYLSNYAFQKSNPFDGQSISSSDFISNYKAAKSMSFLEDESIKDTIEYIKKADIDEKKAYILYYALISNESLNNDEKKILRNAIKYFCDNIYIDYEFVYDQLFNIEIKERNAKFPNTTISSTYSRTLSNSGKIINGEIKLGNSEDIFHEFIVHGSAKNLDCSWIDEGFASIIDAEYNNDLSIDYKGNVDVYPVETNVIRFLCELMGKKEGKDCFFKIAAGKLEGNETSLDLLSSYLIKAGIPATLCDELYAAMDNFSEYNGKKLSSEENLEVHEILRSVVGILSKMYEEICNNKNLNNFICSSYLNKILNREYTYLSFDKFYYFNSEQISKYPNPITIKYFYPSILSKKIINKRQEKVSPTNSLWPIFLNEEKIINGIPYLLIDEKEASMCDKSKIVMYEEIYFENGYYVYIKNNETNKLEYKTSYLMKDGVEAYLRYYNSNSLTK